MTRYPSLLAVCAAATLAAACGFQHSSSVTAPTQSGANASNAAAATSASGSTAPSLVGVWTSSVTPTLPSPSSCGNFQYQVASQTATTIAGTFTASCGNGLTISASANGRVDRTNVTLTLDGSGSMPGLPNCNFNVTSNGTIEDNGNTLNLPYSGTTCLGPVRGTEVLHRPQPQQAAPSPAPAPPPPPPPPAPSGPSDGLDLRGAVITGGSPQDVADWPITTQITGLDFGGNGLRIDFSKKDGPDRWPDVVPPGWDGPIQYTVWMVVNVGGRWYTSGGVEYWYGLDRSGGPPASYAYNWYYNPQVWGPLANQQPGNGQQTGFFVTAGDQRVKDAHIVAERSNVVVLPFPSGGGYFTFSAGRTR